MSLFGLGVVDPEMIAWREEHATALRADFTELKALASTVPPLQQAEAQALIAQWNVWTSQAIADVEHATTADDIADAAQFYLHKLRTWRQELLALGAHETTAVTTAPPRPIVHAEGSGPEVVEAGFVSSGNFGYVVFGAVVLYLATGAFIASQSRWSLGQPRRVRYSRRR